MSPKARRPHNSSANRSRKPGSNVLNGGFFSTFGALALAPSALPDDEAPAPDQPIAKHDDKSQGSPILPFATTPSPAEQTRLACQAWAEQLAELAGGSPLHDVRALGTDVLDLTTAHPSGIVQLFTYRTTRLSSLFRDESSLLHAHNQAAAVLAHLTREAQNQGIGTLYLGYGVASWHELAEAASAEPVTGRDGETASTAPITLLTEVSSGRLSHEAERSGSRNHQNPSAEAPNSVATSPIPRPKSRESRLPVLLHPISLELQANGEYALNLQGVPEINPILATKLRNAGGLLDPISLAGTTLTAGGFSPSSALKRIEAIGQAVFGDFELHKRTMVGAFTQPAQAAAADLALLEPGLLANPLIKALAGDEQAASSLRNMPLPEFVPNGALGNCGVGALSPKEQQALMAVGTGQHLFLNTPAGAESEALVAAVVAEAAAQGKSVLHVSGQRRVGAALKQRLTDLGLAHLVLEAPAQPDWRTELNRQLLWSMSQTDIALPEFPYAAQYVDVHTQLDDYVSGLHRKHHPWGVSIDQAFSQVAALTSDNAQTTVRFPIEVLRNLSLDTRTRLNRDLLLAAQTGAFSPQIVESPWYGAKVADHAHALAAHTRVSRLAKNALPQLLERIAYICEYCGLNVPQTLNEFGELLTMLDGMRGTLEVFLPRVFERSVAELVLATSPRKDRAAQQDTPSALATRRLRKQARELVRPGVRVADLSAELTKVEAQREIWAQYAARPSYPVMPAGLDAVEELYQSVQNDVADLEGIIGSGAYPTNDGVRLSLSDWSLLELDAFVNHLAADTAALENLPARERALHQLRRNGLSELLDDLAARQVPTTMVTAEFDLAWWGSLLQTLLEAEPMVAHTAAPRLAELTDEFRQLDAAYAAASGASVSQAVRDRLNTALQAGEFGDLYRVLSAENPPAFRDLLANFGKSVTLLRPIIMASPLMVPHLLPAEPVIDVLVLDGVQNQSLPELLCAVGRAHQVVVVGDAQSAIADAAPAFAKVLAHVDLPAKPCRRDGEVTRLLTHHGYQGLVTSAPLPRIASGIHFEQVDGRGLASNDAGIVEAPEAEVQRAVELAIDHAKYRSAESLAIIAVTQAHAEAIAAGLATAVAGDHALAEFFGPGQTEPVVVSAANGLAGLRRDAVIFTLGLGRTAHGRVLHGFGPISGERGAAVLNSALGVSRKRLTVLSSFGVDDLDAERIHGDGPAFLYELLSLAKKPRSGYSRTKNPAKGLPESDSPLLAEVGQRLLDRGYLVEYQYGCRGGEHIPMVVGHPSIPQERLVAVLDDGPAYAAQSSLRVRDCLVPESLIALGWAVTQVWSVAAFLDPEAEADRIAALVEEALIERLSARTETAPVPVVEAAPSWPAPSAGVVPSWSAPQQSESFVVGETNYNFMSWENPAPAASNSVPVEWYQAPVAAQTTDYVAPMLHQA